MAKGDLIRNAVEAIIVIGKDLVPAGNALFEVSKWLFDKYNGHKVNKRREFWGVAPPPLPWLQGYVNKKYRETPRQVWGVAPPLNIK